jgi:hypothetical protein
MPFGSDAVAVGVVVKASAVCAPECVHGMARIEHEPRGRPQALGPRRRRAETSGGPSP